MAEAAETRPSWMEKNLQNLIMAFLGMITAWMATTVQTLTVTTAEMNTKIGFLTESMKEANANTTEIANLKARVAVVESKVRMTERQTTSSQH